jgi:peptidylprolyl isomerase
MIGLDVRCELPMPRLIARLMTAVFGTALIGAAAPSPWWPLDAENTLVVDTTKGRIVVEMRPDFAPQAVARVKLLSREGVYDGLLFHRVIDGFVDQTGNPNNHDGGVSSHPDLPPEFTFTLEPRQIDAMATQASDGISGFVGPNPFAAQKAARPGAWRAWGVYCDGVAGMGRQADPGTTNSEIFFMRAPARRLDHDYAVWGRVVQGLDVVRAINVGEPPAHPDSMVRVRVMADLPVGDRPKIEVIDTSSAEFHAEIAALRRDRGADFSLCDVPIATRATPN